MDRYDADQAPNPDAWMALDEDRRLLLIRQHHRGRVERTLHSAGHNRELHAALHQVVESQIASREPAVTAETVARLEAEGLRRHAAIHAVADVLVRTLASGQPHDPEIWAAQLRGLTAGDWLGQRMRRDLGATR
jgi:hypothetical protein